MANLLYVERGIGCYVGWSDGDYGYGSYCYGYETALASYYADLKPNTTYTIQRIDTSTRFRIALTSTDVKYYVANSGTTANVFSWGYKADSSNPVTFTTGDTNTHLVVYYTNNSEYNTRVMLNEGSSIESYEAPTRTFRSWSLVDDILVHDELPEPIDEALSEPYPASLWRLDSDDILTLNNEDWSPFPEPLANLTPPYPATMWYLDEYKILLNALLPEEPAPDGIVHDIIDGKEYFNVYDNSYERALQLFNRSYRIRLEILSDDETAIGEITKDLSITASGQININYEQITRRSCSLSLINVENKYIPTKNSPFWLNRKFRLWLGLIVNKDTYWWSQGIFYTVSANATGRILSIEAVDKGGALDGTLHLNMTESQYLFGRGKKITEIIKQTLSLDVGNPYGATNSPIGFGGNKPIDCKPPLIGIEYYGFNTVADVSIDTNNYISEMFIKMSELYAADCYYNVNGHLVFEPHIDSTGYKYVPTQWTFTDLSSTFEDVNYEYSFEGENVVTVYTNTTQAGVRNVSWTAYNTNPLSPLNVSTGIRRASHIEIPYYYNESLSQDEQEAQQIKDCRSTANHYLLANSMIGMTLNFNSPIIPHMDVNKTIDITDQYADIEDGIYVIQSITIPLSSDKMAVTATNINWLPNDMTFSGVSEIIENESNNNSSTENSLSNNTENNNGNGGAGT